jgi:hypothetical protein
VQTDAIRLEARYESPQPYVRPADKTEIAQVQTPETPAPTPAVIAQATPPPPSETPAPTPAVVAQATPPPTPAPPAVVDQPTPAPATSTQPIPATALGWAPIMLAGLTLAAAGLFLYWRSDRSVR